jgi:hypothetical protein
VYSLTPEEELKVSTTGQPKRVRKDKVEPRYVASNFPLPKFSNRALNMLSVGGVRLLSGPVIKEAAYHLVDVMERPTPTEYSNFVEALFLAHPSLKYSADPDVKCKVYILSKCDFNFEHYFVYFLYFLCRSL